MIIDKCFGGIFHAGEGRAPCRDRIYVGDSNGVSIRALMRRRTLDSEPRALVADGVIQGGKWKQAYDGKEGVRARFFPYEEPNLLF